MFKRKFKIVGKFFDTKDGRLDVFGYTVYSKRFIFWTDVKKSTFFKNESSAIKYMEILKDFYERNGG